MGGESHGTSNLFFFGFDLLPVAENVLLCTRCSSTKAPSPAPLVLVESVALEDPRVTPPPYLYEIFAGTCHRLYFYYQLVYYFLSKVHKLRCVGGGGCV